MFAFDSGFKEDARLPVERFRVIRGKELPGAAGAAFRCHLRMPLQVICKTFCRNAAL